MVKATAGKVCFSGNSLFPYTDTVLRLESWTSLSESEKRQVRIIQHWLSEEDREAQMYVRYAVQGLRSTRITCVSTFEATRYESHEDMIVAYAKSRVVEAAQ